MRRYLHNICFNCIQVMFRNSSPSLSSIQLLSCVRFFATPMDCSTPGLPVHHQLPEFTQTHVHWIDDAIQPSHPLSSPSVFPFSFELQSFPASGSFQMSRLFASGGQSFNISPSNEYTGLISCRIDWFDLLAVQGTLKSLLQPHSSEASS